MKRLLAGLLSLLLLLSLTACIRSVQSDAPAQPAPLVFYYCTTDYDSETGEARPQDYSSATGALYPVEQKQDLRELPLEELLQRYLQGPEQEGLTVPFPVHLDHVQWTLEDGLLSVTFGTAAAELSGIEKTLSAACLTCTMTQLPEIQAVMLPELSEEIFTAADFVLTDDTATSQETVLRIYFTDEDCRYLEAETRNHLFQEDELVTSYVVRQLLAGPEKADGVSALPQGTRMFWIRVDGGVCTVNFSEEFMKDAPSHHIEARAAVYAVVNTLTEIPTVESVQILCSGKKVDNYGGIDLSQPLYREEGAIRTGREDPGLYDATIYVTAKNRPELMPVPVLVPNTQTDLLARDVLNALIGFEPGNGYRNPVPEGTVATEVNIRDGLCTVVFNSTFALCDSDPAQARQAVRAVVSTLGQLENVNRVKIEILEDKLSNVDLSMPLRPEARWIHP